jgi:FkbM family methyltransferase
MTTLYIKHLLLRTPLEQPALRLRHFAESFHRMRHPELREVFEEEDGIGQVVRQVVQPGSNCIDIGCHIGSSLSLMARYAPQGKHLAIEPVAEKAAWIRKKFPEVEVRAIALGERQEAVTFYQNVARPGFSSLAKNVESGDEIVAMTVDCERLDNVARTDLKYAFIKIDVEGAELLVLKGARETIARSRPVILFESSYDGAAKLGLKREDLFAFFGMELGYDVFTIKRFLERQSKLDLAGFQRAAEYPFQAFNFVAVPRPLLPLNP